MNAVFFFSRPKASLSHRQLKGVIGVVLGRFLGLGGTLRVMYSNWFKPIRGKTHSDRLESFYESQADVYDSYREQFLHGRKPMLESLAARLVKDSAKGTKKFVWLDAGGGTGWNIECMESILKGYGKTLESVFDQIIVFDLCTPLLDVARARIKARKWKIVSAKLGDICQPLDETIEISVATFSYSLSMIPDFFSAIDNVLSHCKSGAWIGVCDFYVSSRFDRPNRQTNWFHRTLWPICFDLDGIQLSAERRNYLDHKIDICKEFNDAGSVPYVPLLRIPFYLMVGQFQSGEKSDEIQFCDQNRLQSAGPGLFDMFIYPYTWEDPEEDEKHFSIGGNDTVMSLASGGDNLFDLLIQGAKKVIAVDLNPCQIDIVELKAVAIQQLSYDQVW